MAITINGTANTVAGVAAGGINDNVVDNGTMADDAIGVAELSATGTASSSTYLRGDNAWATPTSGIADTHQSVAKVWVNFNGDGTVAINQDYGVSSITDHGTGDFTINFDSNFADNDYCFVGMAENGEGTSNHDSHTIISGYYGGQAVGSFRLATLRTRFDQEPPQFQDCAATCVAFFR